MKRFASLFLSGSLLIVGGACKKEEAAPGGAAKPADTKPAAETKSGTETATPTGAAAPTAGSATPTGTAAAPATASAPAGWKTQSFEALPNLAIDAPESASLGTWQPNEFFQVVGENFAVSVSVLKESSSKTFADDKSFWGGDTSCKFLRAEETADGWVLYNECELDNKKKYYNFNVRRTIDGKGYDCGYTDIQSTAEAEASIKACGTLKKKG